MPDDAAPQDPPDHEGAPEPAHPPVTAMPEPPPPTEAAWTSPTLAPYISDGSLAPVSGEDEEEDPTALMTRWLREEWRQLLDGIVEHRAAPPALGRLDLRHAPWAGANLSSVEIRWADLREAELRGARLGGADLCGTDLRGADLQGANLKGSDLCAVNLSDANLAGADLSFVDLSHGKLVGANLRGAMMPGADLSGVDLSSAILDGSSLAGTLYDDDTRWPENFDPAANGLVLED